jgi:tRNA A-37 threonylcarbamoyl transferase component Bud32
VGERGEASGGFRWRAGPVEPPAFLAPVIAAFPGLEGLRGVVTLKENRFRTVLHVPGEALAGGAGAGGAAPGGVIGKAYRYRKGWDRFKYRFLRHRAAQEWTALRRLEAAGLPVPRPLAVGEDRRGGAVRGGGLIMTFIPDAVRLAAALADLAPGDALSGEARSLLEAAGALVRRLHDRGVWHRDLHAGNILVSRRDGSLHLIDLHSAVFLPRLPRWLRRRGVARLHASLEGAVPDEGLRALIAAAGAGGEAAVRRIARRIARTRIRSRSRRCFVPSTLFAVERLRGRRIYHLRSFAVEALEPLLGDEPPGECLKRSPRGWVAAAVAAGARVCVKHRRYSPVEVLQAVFESHPLRRAYGAGHALGVRGIETPRVIALRERRVLGMVLGAHLVTALVDGAPLDRFLLDAYWGKPPARGAAARRKRLIAEEVGAFLRRVHDEGLSPHDFSPQNLLVARAALAAREEDPAGSGPILSWVDLDHLYLWKPLLPRRRRRNLIQIASLPEGHVTAADRLRGLESYARGDRSILSAALVKALRRGILAEHYRALERLLVRDRAGRSP